AWSAVHAAELVLNGENAAYALCRPPGHHAGPDIAGGFCYLNNTAIAAEYLRNKYNSVAILDVDLHHGNGTQMIFYDRSDVLTVSIHADPKRFYPFFWGNASECGKDDGLGYNLNLPLPRGTKDDLFLEALDSALERITDFTPDALIIALGLDAYEGDPIAGLAISTNGFRAIGQKISAATSLPTVIIQEGGYPCDELGSNLAAFMSGLKGEDNV
ncbi:MAG: histone deacetylase family protein, partial [Kordiimonadaceae bacterium]|nr:histone deacetylase family protein [Kordiimonadaceae bacterium]